MKSAFVTGAVLFLLLTAASCAPVIRKDLMETGIRDVPLSEVKKNPDGYKGKLFILGGIVANTRVTREGSLVEAVYVPVDSQGYLTGNPSGGRYLALLPRDGGMLDPVIFQSGKKITVAGEFVGTSPGMLDEMEYIYPFFMIKEIYLWEERVYSYPPPYFYPYPYSWWDYPHPLGWWGGPYWGRGFWW